MRCSITIYKWRNLFLFCGNFAGPSTLVTNVEACCFHEALHLCSFYSLTLRFLLFILNLLIYRWVVLCRSYSSKPSCETCRFLRGSILYYVRTVLFVLQTYNLVWVILWQIWTVLASRLDCGPFSLMLQPGLPGLTMHWSHTTRRKGIGNFSYLNFAWFTMWGYLISSGNSWWWLAAIPTVQLCLYGGVYRVWTNS